MKIKILKLLYGFLYRRKLAKIVPILSKHKHRSAVIPVNHNIKHIERAEGVDPKLLNIAKKVSLIYPLVVLMKGGVRKQEVQNKLVKLGVSKTKNSKHVIKKGEEYCKALDVAPIIDGIVILKDKMELSVMCGLFKAFAFEEGVEIRQGCRWDKKRIKDNKFQDFFHQELAS